MRDRDRYQVSAYKVSRDNGRREWAKLDMKYAKDEAAQYVSPSK